MKLRILSWNVRGTNDREKRKLIKEVIKSQKADLVSPGNKNPGDVERFGQKPRGWKMLGVGGFKFQGGGWGGYGVLG